MTGQADDARDVNALAAALRSRGDDVSLYAGMLLNTLSAALPRHMTHVERERGLLIRRKGRAIRAVTITVGEWRFRLARESPRAVPVATVNHVVRGIVLSIDTVPLTQWTDQLVRQLADVASSDAGVADAIEALIARDAR